MTGIGKFEDVNLERVRLISFDEREIRVIMRDQSEVVFWFRNQEQMEAAIAYWAAARKRIAQAKPVS